MSQLPTYVITDRNGAKTVSTGSAWEPKMGYSRAGPYQGKYTVTRITSK